MILRRYGTSYQSVDTNFNPSAMTEIGFRQNRDFSISVDDFEGSYTLVESQDLVAEADAEVQNVAEAKVLDDLNAALQGVVAGLGEGQVVVILNGRDDHPKTRERKEPVIIEGENRLHFHWWIDPPLKVAVYQRG